MKISCMSIRKTMLLIAMVLLGLCNSSIGQSTTQYIRIVNIIVDNTKLVEFKAALKKSIEASVSSEPGTITIHAVYDNANLTHVTVFEIYENKQAHEAHQQTAYFREYREATNNMVKSVVRTEASAIALESKQISASQKNKKK